MKHSIVQTAQTLVPNDVTCTDLSGNFLNFWTEKGEKLITIQAPVGPDGCPPPVSRTNKPPLNLKGCYWMNILSIAFKAGQSDLFSSIAVEGFLLVESCFGQTAKPRPQLLPHSSKSTLIGLVMTTAQIGAFQDRSVRIQNPAASQGWILNKMPIDVSLQSTVARTHSSYCKRVLVCEHRLLTVLCTAEYGGNWSISFFGRVFSWEYNSPRALFSLEKSSTGALAGILLVPLSKRWNWWSVWDRANTRGRGEGEREKPWQRPRHPIPSDCVRW